MCCTLGYLFVLLLALPFVCYCLLALDAIEKDGWGSSAKSRGSIATLCAAWLHPVVPCCVGLVRGSMKDAARINQMLLPNEELHARYQLHGGSNDVQSMSVFCIHPIGCRQSRLWFRI